MLDLKKLRDDPKQFATALARRGGDHEIARIVELDQGHRDILHQVEQLKKTRNEASRRIGGIVKSGGDVGPLREEMKRVGAEIHRLEEQQQEMDVELEQRLRQVPNTPHPEVPDGRSEADNRTLRSWGEPPEFDFEPAAHWDIGDRLGILDFERAAKMSGARYVLYVGLGARLERALIQFMLDLHTSEHQYTEVLPPLIVHPEALFGTGQLPKFESDLFRTEPGGNFLIPTAEVPVTNIHADEIIAADKLPVSYCAFTPWFRSEAGSHGKDVRGLIRLHQFNKVELVRFCEPQQSYDELERLTAHAEEVLKRLDLHYRVVDLCAADLGFSAARTYDLEVWIPSQKVYREISSCSNFEAFQARRAKIRYRPAAGERPRPLHTLTGSALAVGRTVVAILENYQCADGSVVIPEALRPYMGGVDKIEPS